MSGEILKEESSSFLKKRTKKLLPFWYGVWGSGELNNQKFFGSFFQKRTAFFLLAGLLRRKGGSQ
jgi:hypothetical protein